METGDKSILLRIYQEKVQEKVLKDSELEALKQFIDDGDADKANEALDYQTVENAIESLLPGKEWGDYFKSHFKPFLNVRLKTLEQKQALQNILEYCDETTLKVPFIMGIGAKMIGGIAQETRGGCVMKEFWSMVQMVFTGIGGWLGYFLGGCDGLIMALLWSELVFLT